MEYKFKVGDKVKCIEGWEDNGSPKKGDIFEVISCSQYWIGVKCPNYTSVSEDLIEKIRSGEYDNWAVNNFILIPTADLNEQKLKKALKL